MKPIYLDYAAATPVDPTVLDAMRPFFGDQFYNPSALYQAARDVRSAVEAARAQVARCLGARPAEIIFTAGGTEANNLAITGVMERHPGSRIVMSAIEHDSVLEAGKQYDNRLSPVTSSGITDVAALFNLIDDQTVLISVMYANNEIGTIQPIREIAQGLKTVRQDRQRRGIDLPLYLHTDAAQAANYLDLQTASLGVDLLTLNGGKIYGPKQSGLLYVRGGIVLEPLMRGGGQERKLRSGTENVPAIIGFAAALQLAQSMRQAESRRLATLQRDFVAKLSAAVPQIVITGSLRQRLPNNIHFQVPGFDNERLLYQLDAAGIMAAAGSACSAASDTPSHVLAAIGLTEDEARTSLRMTMGRSTTAGDMERVLDVLQSLTVA